MVGTLQLGSILKIHFQKTRLTLAKHPGFLNILVWVLPLFHEQNCVTVDRFNQ